MWIEALNFCGFDSEAVIAHSFSQDPDPDFIRQESQVTFEEYCQLREAGFGRFEEFQNTDVDTDEEESDKDFRIGTDGGMDQSTEDDMRVGSEVGGSGQSIYVHSALHTQNHNAIGLDSMEQPTEGWRQ
jgi:hypothetical protein